MNNTTKIKDVESVDLQREHNVGAGGVGIDGSIWRYCASITENYTKRLGQCIIRADKRMGYTR